MTAPARLELGSLRPPRRLRPVLRKGHALAWGAVPLLVRAVGLSHARDLVLGDRVVDAETAADWRIVQRVVADAELSDAVDALAGALCEIPVELLAQMRSALVNAHLPGAAHADADRSIAASVTSMAAGTTE